MSAQALEKPAATAAAAARFRPEVQWRQASVLSGDFSCKGQAEHAILGTNKTEIVVAIFVNSLSKPPSVLAFSASARNPATAELKIEANDFDLKQFEQEVGYVPEGLQPSKTCMGLSLSDGDTDAAHIYWNRRARTFSAWSQ